MERIDLILKIPDYILAVVLRPSGGTVSATVMLCTLTWKI